MKEVEDSGGRFLKVAADGNGYELVDPLVAHRKTTQFFRDSEKSAMSRDGGKTETLDEQLVQMMEGEGKECTTAAGTTAVTSPARTTADLTEQASTNESTDTAAAQTAQTSEEKAEAVIPENSLKVSTHHDGSGSGASLEHVFQPETNQTIQSQQNFIEKNGSPVQLPATAVETTTGNNNTELGGNNNTVLTALLGHSRNLQKQFRALKDENNILKQQLVELQQLENERDKEVSDLQQTCADLGCRLTELEMKMGRS